MMRLRRLMMKKKTLRRVPFYSEIIFGEELDAVIGDPVEVIAGEAVGVEGTGAVLDRGDLVLAAELELTNRIKECRCESPHLVHGLGTRVIIADEGAVGIGGKRVFGAEIMDIATKEDSLQFLRMFIFLLTYLTSIDDADPRR